MVSEANSPLKSRHDDGSKAIRFLAIKAAIFILVPALAVVAMVLLTLK
jgi:hypothetical protein